MLKIINKNNKKKIDEAFEVVQGRSTARTICYNDLAIILNRVEKQLGKLMLLKKEWEGVKFHYCPEVQVSRKYKYEYLCTVFTLEYQKGKWRIDLDSIRRIDCKYNYLPDECSGVISLTKVQEERVKQRLIKTLSRVW